MCIDALHVYIVDYVIAIIKHSNYSANIIPPAF